jgi:hypothetical protein
VDGHLFDHAGPWTEDVYLRLPVPDDGRVELVDGALVVGPGATPERTRVVAAVRAAVTAALPDGLRVVGPVPLRLDVDCVVVPDLVVARVLADTGPDADPVLDAADALMVVEVVGTDHGAFDRSFKPQLYARSRIPYSLLVDHDVPFMVANMVISGRYHEYARAAALEVLRVEEPFTLEIDLAAGGDEDREPREQDAVTTGGGK